MESWGKNGENVSTNQRQGWLSRITNDSKKEQHFSRNPTGTFMVSLVTGHAVVLNMKYKI